jgi:hypothetical protein
MARRIAGFTLLVSGALMGAWIVLDWARPVRLRLTRFDPAEVARLETAMWRAYYEHRPFPLFASLHELLQRQYGLPFWRAADAAFHAASAARTFQSGSNRTEYERALPALRHFYAIIRRGSDRAFDPEAAAAAELEWWISHRLRSPDLPQRLAELQSCIYREPTERFLPHARARAEAMLFRDSRGKMITDADWTSIETGLRHSWSRLRAAVSPGSDSVGTPAAILLP